MDKVGNKNFKEKHEKKKIYTCVDFNLEDYLLQKNPEAQETLRKTAESAANNNNEKECEKFYQRTLDQAQREADIKNIDVRSENSEKLWRAVTEFFVWVLDKGKYVFLSYFIVLLFLYAFNFETYKNIERAMKGVFTIITSGTGGAIFTYFVIQNKRKDM